jgi:RNA binding exosome subunit
MTRNLILENVLIKMNQIPELTAEEREKYGKQLELINYQVENVKKALVVSNEITSQVETVHSKCLQLHRQVDTFGEQYQRLDATLARFKKCCNEMDALNMETEAAWNKLGEVEQKLLKVPSYAGHEESKTDDNLKET